MSRRFISGVVALAGLILCSVAFSNQPAPAPKPPDSVSKQPGLSAELQLQKLQDQIDDMRAAHQDLITQLTAIRTLAVKEKATGTASVLERLISKQQETFQAKVHELQQQQQTLRQALRLGTSDRPTRGPRKASEFQLKSTDDKTVRLIDYRGKIVVLEWINLECPFSLYHHKTRSTMADLASKYKDKGVVWLAINSTASATPQANAAFVKECKLPYPILDDKSGQVGRLYGALRTPQIFIVDPQRSIVYEGAIDNAATGEISEGGRLVNYVDQALAALTSDKEVPTPITLPYGSTIKYAAQ
jgi:peroxiredoxin